jgi:hypothetical protein
VIVSFVDIDGIVDHHCLEVIVSFVDIDGNVDHHCLEVVVSFVDGGENLLVVFSFCIQSNKVRGDCSFVDIGENVDHHCLNILFMLYVYFPPLLLHFIFSSNA